MTLNAEKGVKYDAVNKRTTIELSKFLPSYSDLLTTGTAIKLGIGFVASSANIDEQLQIERIYLVNIVPPDVVGDD